MAFNLNSTLPAGAGTANAFAQLKNTPAASGAQTNQFSASFGGAKPAGLPGAAFGAAAGKAPGAAFGGLGGVKAAPAFGASASGFPKPAGGGFATGAFKAQGAGGVLPSTANNAAQTPQVVAERTFETFKPLPTTGKVKRYDS